MYAPSGAFWLMTPSRSRNAAFVLMKNCFFGEFRDDVSNENVALLNARSFIGRRAQAVVRSAFHLASSAPRQSHGMDPHLFGNFESFKDVRRVAAGGNTD